MEILEVGGLVGALVGDQPYFFRSAICLLYCKWNIHVLFLVFLCFVFLFNDNRILYNKGIDVDG